MSILFALATFLSFVGMIVGLAVPEMALAWFGGRRTRGRVLRIYGLTFLASWGLFSATDGGLPPIETVPPLSATSFAPPIAPADAPVAAARQEVAMTFYAHSNLNVRSRPSASSRVIRTLRRGETVSVGEARNGWLPVLVNKRPDGYVSRGTGALHSYAPSAAPAPLASFDESRSSVRPAASSRRGSASSRGYHTGPRGGCYYYSASGRKQYVDRSNCN